MIDPEKKNVEHVLLAKITKRIGEIERRFIRAECAPVTGVALAETKEFLSLDEAKKLTFKEVGDGHRWGGGRKTGWFRLVIRIPRRFNGETVVLHFETGGECLVFRGGEPVQALDHGRPEYILYDSARGGEEVELFVEGVAGGSVQGWSCGAAATLALPHIAVLNRDVRDACWDLSALADMVAEDGITWQGRLHRALPVDDTRRATIVFALSKAVDIFDYGNPTREELKAQAMQVRRALTPLYGLKARHSAQTIACMGHSHIDVAWLWPLAETIRKCGRTFANVLDLMDRYPDFRFVQSQPLLYELTRDRYPSLYRRIRKKAKEGQWIPVGCMWVEADCNITGGESLVRQVLFGTRFFKSEFNREPVCLWLPDVFGYSAGIPQILKRSGIDCFLTQKIFWSQFTNFPYHSFRWEGIDGTRVLAHVPPIGNFNSALEAREIMTAERNYSEKDRSPIQAVSYGYGDGGGGPTRLMLERLRRYRDLDGMPKLVSMDPGEFFRRLERESVDLPVWVGELYLEYHRGTYTTQAHTKKCNRLLEFILRECEMLSAIDMVFGGRYEQSLLNEAWKLLLLNQFHDILPGSSISEVYRDSGRDYEKAFEIAKKVKTKALSSVARKVDTRGEGVPVLAFNSLSWERNAVVALGMDGALGRGSSVAVSQDGVIRPVQPGHDGIARFSVEMAPMGHAVYHIRPGRAEAPIVLATEKGMENDRLRLDFDLHGRVRRIYDKCSKRDVLEPGASGNRLILFEDKAVSFNSGWEIDYFYKDKPIEANGRLLSVKVMETGAVRSVVRFRRAISKSVVTQDIILWAGSSRVDFATTVEWGDEKDVILKVAFPVNVRSDNARYEIQFGNVERPTHRNRPCDLAMFEVPAQKWADISEGDYGVALLNDCKYGYDTFGNVMSLTLLRAARDPDERADANRVHSFTYSILPHSGNYTNGVVRAGYELNVPVTAAVVKASGGAVPACASHMGISGENVIIETVKKAEDDSGLVVRLYEAHGCRGRRAFSCAIRPERALEINLMEEEEKALDIENGRISLDFEPFQIKTLKLVLPERGGLRRGAGKISTRRRRGARNVARD